jgi:hypothetical protein
MAWRYRIAVTCAVAAVAGWSGGAAAQPSSGWIADGRDDIVKNTAIDILKEMMPGANFAFNTGDFVIDPLVTAATTPGTTDEKVDAWLKAMIQAGVVAEFPAYGIALSAGKIVVGTAILTTEQLIAATQDQQALAILTGSGGLLGRANNPTADMPFATSAFVRTNGLTINNLGQKIGSESDLKRLWFTVYGNELRGVYGRNSETVTNALDLAWPMVLDLWKAQAVRHRVDLAVSQLDAAIPKVQRKLAESTTGLALPASNEADALVRTIMGGEFLIPNGTYIDSYTNSTGVITVYRTPTSIAAIEEWATGGRAGTTVWSNCVATNVLTCNWTGDYRNDPDKSGTRSGTLTVQLNGNVLVGTYYENEPNFTWNVPPYESAMRAGAQWPINHTKLEWNTQPRQ